jgi:hypothetical protein
MDALIIGTKLHVLGATVQYDALQRLACDCRDRSAFRKSYSGRTQATKKCNQAGRPGRKHLISWHACARKTQMNQLSQLLIVARLQSCDDGRSSFAPISVSAVARSASSSILLLARLRESASPHQDSHDKHEETHRTHEYH